MRRFLFALLLPVAMIAVVAAVVAWSQLGGIRVTVANRGPEPLTDVVVHVTPNQYGIGSLAPGESRTVRFWPTTESHLELSFVDNSGRSGRVIAGGYFESGYSGSIEIDLEDGIIKRNHHRIKVSAY